MATRERTQALEPLSSRSAGFTSQGRITSRTSRSAAGRPTPTPPPPGPCAVTEILLEYRVDVIHIDVPIEMDGSVPKTDHGWRYFLEGRWDVAARWSGGALLKRHEPSPDGRWMVVATGAGVSADGGSVGLAVRPVDPELVLLQFQTSDRRFGGWFGRRGVRRFCRGGAAAREARPQDGELRGK